MIDVITPGVDAQDFLRRSVRDGYSMQNDLVLPELGPRVSAELKDAFLLVDMVELVPTSVFAERDMHVARLLHRTLNRLVSIVESKEENHLPYFSVRVFEPGQHGTTIHRNHGAIGPWAIGFTLKGDAPFNVCKQEQLPKDCIIPLKGDETDPIPLETMNANSGAAWSLYTGFERVPHSCGIVEDDGDRELIIFYKANVY